MSLSLRTLTSLAAPAALAAALLSLSACSTTPSASPADSVETAPGMMVSLDGLQQVESSRRGEIYAAPGVDWSTYDAIILDPATVAFRKNWERDQNRDRPFKIQPKDVERIKTGLAALFDEVFTQELSAKGGYRMADESGERVMRITPHIVDLDVYAPDVSTAARSYSYSQSAGRMTLKLEIRDSVTGDLIAVASDRQEDPRLGWNEWRTRASNRVDAQRMLQRWATGLRERLDQARRTTTAAG